MALTKISGDVIQSSLTLGIATATSLNVGTGVTIQGGGATFTGVVTATTFSGNLTGNVTGNATGLSGTPNITVGAITAASAVITGNVSVAGTVTYEDVTNVDSIGIVTARSGIVIGTGTSISSPATNTLTLGTNNAERVRVSNGGVSIGSIATYGDSNASFTSLSLGGNGTRYGLLEIKQSNGVAGAWIDSYGTNGNGDLRITTAGTSNNITFWTGGAFTEKVRITSGGNVGIGVTNPDVTFHVNGTNAYPASSGSTPTGMLTLRRKSEGGTHGLYVGVAPASPWGSWLQAQDANNLATNYPLLLNPNGGNIGVGTVNPTSKLHVMDGNITVGDVTLGQTHIDIMKMWRTADIQGYKTTYSDGGGISYTWDNGTVRVDSSIGSHNWDIGKVTLPAGVYQIVFQYRPSPTQHGWNVYGSNSNAHIIRLQSDAGYNSYTQYISIRAQLNKDLGGSRLFSSETYEFTTLNTYRIGMQTDPYVTGGYKYFVEAAYLIKLR